MSETLKPCPFCGAGDTLLEPDSKYWTGISDTVLSYRVIHWCAEGEGVRGSMVKMKAKTEPEAAAKWNARAAVQANAGES